MKTYLYVRKIGTDTTRIMEIDKKQAVMVMKENRNSNYQIGMLTGCSFDTVIKVFGEYAPFHKVKTIDELITPCNKANFHVKNLKRSRIPRVGYKHIRIKKSGVLQELKADYKKEGHK